MRFLAVVLWVLCVCHAAGAAAQPIGDTAFISVNVVPMDQSRVLWNHTVVVQASFITALGPAATTQVPSDARRIEGNGTTFLLPGLADMHTHALDVEELPSYTANGVTTILHLGGAPNSLVASANAAIEQGAAIGPHIYFSLLVDRAPAPDGAALVSTPDEARQAVEFASVNGYDFIKVYNKLTASDFAAIVEESRRTGLSVIGHGVRAIGVPEALFQGQVMVAHAEEFFYTVFNNQRDTDLIPSVVAATLESGAFVMPTLSTSETIAEQWGKPEVVARYMDDPRAQFLTPFMQQVWPDKDYVTREGGMALMTEFLRTFVAALHEAGVPLMTGTDSPVIPGMYPGYSLHHDIQTLIDIGLTPYQALTAATRTPGEFIARYVPTADRFGLVEIGMKADLIMVSANPLEDIETLKSPLGVMSAGRWLSDVELEAVMAEQKAKFDAMLE